MKVIELLNRIANGEEVPKKVKAGYYYYEYEEKGEYINVDDTEDLLFDFDDYFPLEQSLNQDIEIIEEKEMCHKCGKYPAEYNQTYCEFCLGISEEDKKIEKLEILPDNEHYSNAVLYGKINEIIDKINGSE